MLKLAKYLWITAFVLCLYCVGTLIADKQTLHDDLIRLHVVANSDSAEDQERKLKVRDSIADYLREDLMQIDNAEEAKVYLQNSLPELEIVAEKTLLAQNCDDNVTVTLSKESFQRRDYDTFSLPSGVYESLRVEIGAAEGKNWWCVVFPSLCAPTTSEEFVDAAVTNTMNRGLASTLSGVEGYEVRFFLLDLFGKIENFFHFS